MTLRHIGAVALAALLATSAWAGAKKTEEANAATIAALYDTIWNQHDLTGLDAAYGPEQLETARTFATTTLADYPDASLSLDHTLAKGDKVVTEWTFKGTHAKVGKPVELQGVTVARLEGGVVVQEKGFYDTLPVFTQLGVDPFEATADANLAATQVFAEKGWNDLDTDAMFAVIADGGYQESENGGPFELVTREKHEEETAAWRDAKLTLGHTFARGDMVVATWSYTGTHIAAGKEVTFGGTWIGRFADGKLQEVWNNYDTAPLAVLAPPDTADAQ